MFLPKHRKVSISSQCSNFPQEVHDSVLNTTRELQVITNNFDKDLLKKNEPYERFLQEFIRSYNEVEEELILEISQYYNINYSKFIAIIHEFGKGATGDYACAYEAFGEGVGDTLDFYEYNVKNFRHDIIGKPKKADHCLVEPQIADAVQETKAEIAAAYRRVQKQTQISGYDHFIIAYDFLEAFEVAMWKLSEKLEHHYGLGHQLWKSTLVHNGQSARNNYSCAYERYFDAENAHVEKYLRLIMDIIQRTTKYHFN
jgi:hypothetical protein